MQLSTESVETLARVAELALPHERVALLADRFGRLLTLTSRLSSHMAKCDDAVPLTMAGDAWDDADEASPVR
jgi:hypothetical protein